MADVTENLHRLPPQNLDAEASILGGVLLDNDAINSVIELVNPDDLYRESHRKIFRAMVELWDRNEPVDLITLSDHLKAKGELETVGGSAYLAELASQVPTAANIAYYARIVREKAILRHLIRTSTDIATRGLEERGDVDTFLDDAERAIFDISEKRITSSFVKIGDVMTDTIKKVDELYQRKEMVTGVATGYRDVDRLTAGFQPSDLLIVAGRPGMGKTAFALNIAVNAALHGIGVAVFSLEMAMEQLVLRMLCAEARVDHSRLRTGYLRENEFPALVGAAGRLAEAPVYIDDTPAVTVLEVRAKTRRLLRDRTRKIGLVVVDYLAAHARPPGLTQPRAGDLRDITLAQGPGQGVERSRRGAFAAQPAGGGTGRQASGDGGPAGVRRHRAGRRRDHVHLPRGCLRKGRHQTYRRRRGHHRQTAQRSGRHSPVGLPERIHPVRELHRARRRGVSPTRRNTRMKEGGRRPGEAPDYPIPSRSARISFTRAVTSSPRVR